MDSSTLCEYCYCLRGRQTCVKPKCLLPIEGCTPTYDPNQCCPVQYNCTLPKLASTTTTTIVPSVTSNLGGCFIENEFYPEGGKVLGFGHSICDNCYCLRGMLRCEPLSCAPPLLGCNPIVKPGDCCAASYNCTGSIEIDPEPNYGQFPTVSKEYSKLRKEQPRHPILTSNTRRNGVHTNQPKDPFYVIAETPKSNSKNHRNHDTSGTTRQFTGSYFNPSTTTPFYYKSMIKEGASTNGYKHVTRSYPETKFSGTTLNDNVDKEKVRRPAIIIASKSRTTTINLVETASTIDFESTRETSTNTLHTEDTTSYEKEFLESISTFEHETQTTPITEEHHTTDDESSTPEQGSTVDIKLKNSEMITMRSVLNSTDCIDAAERRQDSTSNELTTVFSVAEKINDLSETNEFTPSLEASSSETNDVSRTTDDITEVDLQSSFTLLGVVSPKVKNGSEITSLLNASKTKENDYDFDYNEPTLPPSLPNLHIIPFLAADALDTKKESEKNIFAQDKSSNDSFEFSNFFSPPIKTEGGFVPNSHPVILENLYDNVVTAPSITNSPESIEASCLSKGNKILHGQSVKSDEPCTTCSCFYGNVVCQKVPCPIPGPKCRRSIEDLNLCCPLYVCDGQDGPAFNLGNMVLSQLTPDVTVAGKKTTSDPFKDVIRTEPAPNLQLLMDDMRPHLTKKPVKKTTIYYITTIQPPVSESETEKNTKKKPEDSLSLDKVLALLLGGEDATKPSISTTSYKSKPSSTESVMNEEFQGSKGINHLESEEKSPSTAILKLAGCNIYGRMYRVGRIISELSGPCLECKCTEVGVQCKPLKC
ncbi:hypothetical protein HHI36_007415 [Cryptolaemus montrouzieri]|uniref:VWFC domain-containing protein n=1 Tax=Cryptolaemus montrouzieri TaxID=559131 RepID=A0ABD2MPZ5_9CUCU